MPLELNLAPITALEAVNNMLLSIGQGSIETLEGAEGVDAQNARAHLINTSRSVQARGLWFNRDHNYKLVPDTNGEVLLPEAALEFAPSPRWTHIVERGGKLYNRVDHTYVFPQGTEVVGSITWLLPFEDLPHAAREYIQCRAGRVFQVGAVGSDLLYKFTKELELEAQTELTRAHLRNEQPNIIEDDPRVSWVAHGGRSRR